MPNTTLTNYPTPKKIDFLNMLAYLKLKISIKNKYMLNGGKK